ncbi:11919_t:CDS:2, partial [Racocetra fulgida]
PSQAISADHDLESNPDSTDIADGSNEETRKEDHQEILRLNNLNFTEDVMNLVMEDVMEGAKDLSEVSEKDIEIM